MSLPATTQTSRLSSLSPRLLTSLFIPLFLLFLPTTTVSGYVNPLQQLQLYHQKPNPFTNPISENPLSKGKHPLSKVKHPLSTTKHPTSTVKFLHPKPQTTKHLSFLQKSCPRSSSGKKRRSSSGRSSSSSDSSAKKKSEKEKADAAAK